MPTLLEVFDRRRPKQVRAYPRHHRDFRATQSRSCGLVRPLAAKAQIKALAEDCFARVGESIRERRKVNVCAANYCDSRLFFHRDEFGQYSTEIFEMHA